MLDAAGKQVDEGDSVVDDLNPLAMSVGLGDVPDGTYTVAWKNVSTVDGHRVRGSFVFAVGQPLSATPIQGEEQPLLQSPFSPLLRWLVLLGALTMAGGLVFELLVTRPILFAARSSSVLREAGLALSGRSSRLMWLALAVFLAASVGQLLSLVTVDTSLGEALGGPLWTTLSSTGWGELWLWRIAAAAAFRVCAFRACGSRPSYGSQRCGRWRWLWAGAALWTLALTSHGAATVDIRNMALAADFLHLAASAFWIGALFHFALGLSLLRGLPEDDRRECVADIGASILGSAGGLAVLSVATIIVTGVFSGWAQVTVTEALTTPYPPPYGITLITLKVALVLPLLFLPGRAEPRWGVAWVRPRLRSH